MKGAPGLVSDNRCLFICAGCQDGWGKGTDHGHNGNCENHYHQEDFEKREAPAIQSLWMKFPKARFFDVIPAKLVPDSDRGEGI